jgi:D-glycero-D-manno-heptose 1,7-bisphosphate phosphatase
LFLDRDGVINRSLIRGGKPFPPSTVDELEILSGVREALSLTHEAGIVNVVVTNQPDVATGKQRRAVVEDMHKLLRRKLAIDDIRVCYHADIDQCECRKPRPGMLLDAAHDLELDLASSFLVGDRWRDIGAAHAAGCAAFFIDYSYEEQRPELPYTTVASLLEAVQLILLKTSSIPEGRP